MGQKINPNIFRLGVNKTWKTEFFEKKRHELPLYTFKDLEIKNYVEQFLETQGILLHDYKQHYSNSTLNLYISYFISPDFILNKGDKTVKMVLKNSSGDRKLITDTRVLTEATSFESKTPFVQNEWPVNVYKIRKYLKSNLNSSNSLIKTSISIDELNERALNVKVEGILTNMFRVLSLFTNNKFNLIINFSCLNKDLSFLKRTQRKNFLLLRKFRGTPFLKEGIELLFHVVYGKTSADLLTKFIQIQIKKVKRHKFFLAFLKQTLTVLINSSLSKVKGIKIIIKGRLNGVPRAAHKIITIGDVPVQTVNASIDYSQRTAHNSSGSYGIKVWIVEKKIIKNVFTTSKNKV